MQRARDPEGKGADPVRVFLILAAVLVAVGAAIWLTRPDNSSTEASTPAADTPPDFSLTDEEAIARFKELDELRLRALRERDLSLLSLAFTSDGPAYKRLKESIKQLRNDDVFFRSEYRTTEIQIGSNSPDRIEVIQQVIVSPRFVSESGNDVTDKEFVERQESRWILRPEEAVWLIAEGTIVDAEVIREEPE